MIKSKPSFVIDTSVAVKWFLKEPYEKEALQIRDAFRNRLCTLLAPDLIYAELSNTIWKRVLFDHLDVEEGILMVVNFALIPLEIVPLKDLITEAFPLGLKFKRPIYDALFLSLSIRRDCPLITADEKFYNTIRQSFSDIIWIGNWSKITL